MEPRVKDADLIIGCSEYITGKIAHRFPQYADRCVTVPNAADIPAEPARERTAGQEVVFVGRLSPEKGIHDLIQAFHEVLKRFPDARLRLVGGPGIVPLDFLVGLSDEPYVAALKRFYPAGVNGAKHPYIEALEKEAGKEMGKRILFEGVVGHDQIEKAYRDAAIVVNPSLSESFGISIIEAMMRRIPVVATRIGGMTTTIEDGITGLHVGPADPSELAAAICQLLADPERARAIADAGWTRALERYTWDRVADRYLECVQG
jgi:glycosyltransferase involved in cell wall biosynthesis